MEIKFVRAFADNYIWLICHEGRVAVVDPGDTTPVLDYLRQSGDLLTAILITHHHGDHTGGVDGLLAHRSVPVFGPAAENIAYVDHPLHPLSGTETIDLPGIPLRLRVLDVAGHTRGHIAYYAADYHPNLLFSGDTLFVLGCGRLFEGTPERMQSSLATLRALPDDTLVYSTHEYAVYNLAFALGVEPGNPRLQQRAEQLRSAISTGTPTVPARLEDEKATNPFLRWDSAEVIASASARDQALDQKKPDCVFGTLRAWRNEF
ncbi:MAG: hydroxyacylglutathione hydrolase [Proteobacteria bacterium]|nr:hydroxyacylglutathione hydrolase [Pseudomonadota bacterium]